MKKLSPLFFVFILGVHIVKAQKPIISSLSTMMGYTGSNVVITGSNFNTTAANNVVLFGATRASVTTASDTSLSVVVPAGATYMPVSVFNTTSLRTGYSQYPFLPTYDNSSYVPATVNFSDKVDLTTGTAPQGMAIGDLDRDGKADLVAVNYSSGTISVFRNTSTSGAITAGSFAAKVDFSTGAASNPFCAAIGDVNGDGKPDIVVANQSSATVSVFRNTSSSGSITSGSFAARVDYSTGVNSNPQSIAIGDIDGDGKPDLVVANYTATSISVYRNTYSSTAISFAAKVDFTTDNQPGSVAIGDLDGDNMADIAVANFSSNTLSVFRNTSTAGSISASSLATKVSFTTGTGPRNVAIGDLNNDGKQEIAVVNYTANSVSVFGNNCTTGSITTSSFNTKVDFATGNTPRSAVIGDFDGNGKPDLAVACQNSNQVSVFLNTVASGPINSGSFAARVNFTTGTAPIGVVAGDLDGDGKADLAVCNQTSGSVSVFRNNPIYPIVGVNSICQGATTTLTDATPVGTWVSGAPAVATVGSASGIVTGISGGTTTISYVLGVGRMATFVITINALPDSYTVTGGGAYCGIGGTGVDVGLSGSQTNIAYQLYNNGTATGSPVAGTDSALSLGIQTAAGVYTVHATNLTTSCSSNMGGSVTVSIDTFPNAGAITGAPIDYVATAIILSDTASAGTWSTSNSNASITTTGIVTGITPGTVTVSYSVTNTCGTAIATKLLTINMYDSVIGGGSSVCEESTITLTNASPGVWSSSDTALATVDPVSGVVTGKAAGTVAITYSFDACAGCYMVRNITVKALPDYITGDTSVCLGATSVLTCNTGISWTSSNPSVATIGITSGLVTGIAAGTSIVTFLAYNGCFRTTAVSVSILPGAITGTTLLCAGTTTTLANAVAGGTWSSSSGSVASVTNGIVLGTGPGTATINYTLSSGCATSTTVTVNPLPSAISGYTTICVGATTVLTNTMTGGTWSSSSPAIATISATGTVNGVATGTSIISYTLATGCARTLTLTVAPPLPVITGVATACAGSTTVLGNAVTGGSWSSNNIAVAMVNPTSGMVTGMGAGTATITYTSGVCTATTVATIHAMPATIAGSANVCKGLTTTFSNTISGGTWTSSNTALATVNAVTGVVTGVAAGTPVITYTLVGGCLKTKPITVSNPIPGITGNANICQASTSTLSCAASGGLLWSSDNTLVACIGSASGIVTGVSAGTASVTYSTSSGCMSIKVVTVQALPTAISGTLEICKSATTALSSIGTIGGTWASSNTSKATIGAASGIVTGVNAGTAAVTYTWTNSCKRTAVVTVNPAPTAGAIVGSGTILVGATTTITPSIAGGTWSSANVAIATVTPASGSSAVLSGISAGNVVITYTNTNSCGSAFVTRIFSIVTPRLLTGTEENGVTFTVYPNPTSGTFTIKAPVTGIFTIYAIDGKEVQHYMINEPVTSVSLSGNLTGGIYLCRFSGDDGNITTARLVYEP